MPLTQESLWELTQNLAAPAPIAVSTATLKSLVHSVVDLLIEQQLEANIWVKSSDESWVEEIERYWQQKQASQVYLCLGDRTSTKVKIARSLPKAVSIKLDTLIEQDFFIVLSAQLRGMIVAQPQKAATASTENESSAPQMQATCSFSPLVVEKVLSQLKQAIASPESLPEIPLAPLSASAASKDFLASLLLKQVQHTEIASHTVPEQIDVTIANLSESLRLKEEFLASLVRELRPPVTNMKTALRLLESKQIKRNQRQRYLDLLHRECERHNSLIVGLLELVQLENSADDLPPIRLEDFVPGIVSTYQPLATEKDIILGYTIPANVPAVACPPQWLRQIIINLLNNSLKFTESKGRVYVQASLHNQKLVELVVSDTGIGIESSDLPKIFDSFYRGRTPSSEQMSSAGLGLTIVQQLLQRCGGSISVTSTVGKGTAFKLLLPVASREKE